MPPGLFPVEGTSNCEETPGQIKNTEEGRRIPLEEATGEKYVWANKKVSSEKWMCV